ncbi:MAG: DUF192 domain-containing protein [Candidatus Falkowbacteria bacterium]
MRLTILLLTSVIILSGCANNSSVKGIETSAITDIQKVCWQETCFKVELAVTSAEKSRGLMYRERLAENSGMLFIFERPDIYPFWMKNTLIPLDIIWLNEQREIVFIKHAALPCQVDVCPNIIPAKSASYVLELNAGVAESIGLKIGDELTFN